MTIRRVERCQRASGEVTVRLHGWPAETRMLSVVDACWMVDIEVRLSPASCRVLNHYTSEDYQDAFHVYEKVKQLAQEP